MYFLTNVVIWQHFNISDMIAFCFLVFLLYFVWYSFGNVRVQQVGCYGTSILVLLDISHWAGLVCIAVVGVSL